VYIAQNGGTTLLNDGLAFAAIRVQFDAPSGVAEVGSAGDIVPNAGFDFYANTSVDAVAPIEFADLDEASLTQVYPTSDRILLGTFVFTGLSPGTTTVTVGDLTAGNDFITGLGAPLDGFLTPGSATLTGTAASR
jgi:hypothetical protein